MLAFGTGLISPHMNLSTMLLECPHSVAALVSQELVTTSPHYIFLPGLLCLKVDIVDVLLKTEDSSIGSKTFNIG